VIILGKNDTSLTKIILDVLKEYDYRNISQSKMDKVSEDKNVMGLTVLNRPGKIYVVKSLSMSDYDRTQLHEFAHAYLHMIGKDRKNDNEEEVEKLAKQWHQTLYIK
jgi:hypothetical protein